MRWEENGFLLNIKKHGESRLILTTFTKTHGLHRGLCRSSKKNPLQPGGSVHIEWSARLDDQLGFYKLDALPPFPIFIWKQDYRTLWISALMEILNHCLPERHPYPFLFDIYSKLYNAFTDHPTVLDGLTIVLYFLNQALEAIGHPLDLEKCCVSGTDTDLAFISPKTGRAVSLKEGQAYRDKLLSYPDFYLYPHSERTLAQLIYAIETSLFFIKKCAISSHAAFIHTQQAVQFIKKMV